MGIATFNQRNIRPPKELDIRIFTIIRGVIISTYLFSVGRKNIIHQLKSEIKSLDSFEPEELTEREFNSEFNMLIFGKNTTLTVQKEENHFFRGLMINHETRDVVLGQDGFTLWKAKNDISDYRMFEGGFVSIEWSEKDIRIQHDCFGLYPIFRYSDSEICIVSDSLFLITRTMKMIGKGVRINPKTNLTRSWTYGLACSIMTKETIVQNIIYVPPCAMLNISTVGTEIICSEKQLNVKKVFALEDEHYMKDLIEAKNEIVSLFTTIIESTDLEFKLGLSGGLDSRILLALLLQLSNGLEKAHINSNTHVSRKEDYRVAKSLSEQFDFKINQESPSHGTKPMRVENPYGNFVLFNLGIFDMTYLYRSYWDTSSMIEIGGHGAEISKGTFSDIRLTRKIPIWRPDKKIALYNDLRSALKPFGIKISQRNSTQWHHLLYKSAIQNGRYLERTQISLRPLMNRRLAALGLNNKTKKNLVLRDLLILLSPELASHPFDCNSKNIDSDYIEKIHAESKQFDAVSNKKNRVYGDPKGMKNGFLISFISLTKDYKLDGVDKKKSLLDLMENIWKRLRDEKLKRVYSGAYNLAKERLSNQSSYLPSAGSPASKIIALGILFE